jgi:nucleoside-diphosphate-sugar epimerase
LLDVSKINSLGWKAKYNSEKAIKISVQELREHM